MRLDRYLSNNTEFSRKDVKRLLGRKQVKVNGEVTRDASLHIDENARVELFDSLVEPRRPRYFMLHKPPGCISARSDEQHLGALDLIEEPFFEDLHFAGRLDLDTTGLLLVTDDGQWSQRVTSPKHKVAKTYRVITDRPIEADTAEKFQQGIYLRYEDITTQSAQLDVLGECEARLTIYEGKYHQVKRMFAAVGNHVNELHRESIGELQLDDDLEPGEYRPLDEAEVALF